MFEDELEKRSVRSQMDGVFTAAMRA
jgi:hypothetical protein